VVPVRPRRARELLDLGAVVVLEVPLTAGAVLDQDVGLTTEVDDGVVLLPAQDTALGGGVAPLVVVGAGDGLALDVSRLHRPALVHRRAGPAAGVVGRAGVLRRGPPVGRLWGVAVRQRGDGVAGGVRGVARVGPGDGSARTARRAGSAGREGGRADVAGRSDL